MPATIPRSSTIATVWPHLTHQRDYVAGVLQKLRQCTAERRNAHVRIGVTGTGQKPYYRIFSIDEVTGDEKIFGSYYDNHDPLENGFAMTSNWSDLSMSMSEVSESFSDRLGWKGKRP